MRNIFWVVLLFVSIQINAQTNNGLVAYYFFDGNLLDAQGNSINEGVSVDEPNYACGIVGQSLNFNGGSDEVRFDGQVSDEFNNTEDFTLSIYFKANAANGLMYLISKRRFNCEVDNAFYIRYQPLSSSVNVFMRERDGREINIVQQLSTASCWHHLVLVRNAGNVRLYADGQFLQEQNTIGRIDLMNEGNLVLGSSDCFGQNEVPFNGVIDEMRVYNRALNENEIRDLYLAPEKIATRDTVIFLGNSVPVNLTANCASTFTWDPVSGVSNPSAPNPVITPFAEGDFTYSVQMSDFTSSCVATDSILITVVDPNNLDCTEAFLPTAFTPNNDGVNDTYGLSNPFAIPELISFEIFDRWGSRVFATNNAFNRWDGSYMNKEVNPGVMQYKVRFFCNGEEREQFGTFMVMR